MFLAVNIESGAVLSIPAVLEGSVNRSAGSNRIINVRVNLPFVDPLRGETGMWVRVTELVDEQGNGYKHEEIERLLLSIEPKPNSDEVGRARSFFRDNGLPKGDGEMYVHHLSRIFAHIRCGRKINPVGPVGIDEDHSMSVMCNWEVAQQYIGNALAYGRADRSGGPDIATVMHNLELIRTLMETPNQVNESHDWGDFK